MAHVERVREAIHGKLDLDDIQRKYAVGWRITALEWEREAAPQAPVSEPHTPGRVHDLPFGLRVASDCMHLEEDPGEMRALRTMMELIVQDISLQRMADELNRAGCSTRDGEPWTALAIFNILPRLIDATPEILRGEDWKSRRRAIARVSWNS